MCFFIYDANYLIIFLKKKLLHKWLKELTLIYIIQILYSCTASIFEHIIDMNLLALNDDVKFIISNDLQSDRKINKVFTTEPDENLQKILFGEVKEMTLDIENICIDLSNNNKNLTMKLDFLKKIIIKFTWANVFMNHMKN